MSVATRSPARLWVLLARDAPAGVIFRRGPSRHALLIKWDTRRDSFQKGQWLKARVYERRCDLSRNGKLLIYFAANYKPPLYSWTAISKPPYFAALALWPKGDCWNGGGWFLDNSKVQLNHKESEGELHSDFRLGPIKVVGHAEGPGEDDTVWNHVLERDGWKQTIDAKWKSPGLTKGWASEPPEQRTKAHPTRKNIALEMAIIGIGGDQGTSWYQINYRVLRGSVTWISLGVVDWADWDQRGDLVFAKRGCLFRQRLARSLSPVPVRIADFNELKFENVSTPAEAARW